MTPLCRIKDCEYTVFVEATAKDVLLVNIVRDLDLYKRITQTLRFEIMALYLAERISTTEAWGRHLIKLLTGIPLANAAESVLLEDQLAPEQIKLLSVLNDQGLAITTKSGDAVFVGGLRPENNGTLSADALPDCSDCCGHGSGGSGSTAEVPSVPVRLRRMRL